MRLSKRGAFAIGVVALVACGGSGSAPSSSDSGGVADASDETIIITSDATLPTDGASSDSESPDSSVDGGPQTDGSVIDSAPPAETGPSCEAGTVDCNGVCVNEQTDPNHCGSCTKVCAGPDAGLGVAICSSATCAVGCDSDSGTSLLCGSDCVDPIDINHCGTCSNVCAPPTANGTALCAQGGSGPACTFACTAGYHACGGTCLSNTDDPSNDPCVVADGLGTFVSPTGSDSSGNGTKESPYATIGFAMGQATSATKRVYACGTFTAGVTVTSADDGVTVYGGFSCASWTYSAATPTHVTPSAAGLALQVTGTTTGVVFEDFAFTAQSAPSTAPASTSTLAASSIAVFVSGAKATFTRVSATAGSGQPGASGGAASVNWSGTPAMGEGPSSLTMGGSGGAQNLCNDKTWSEGGMGASVPGTAVAGSSSPAVGLPNEGFSGNPGCTVGGTGANGAAPTVAASGSTTSGSVGASGWTVGANGSGGANGNPGQGGGGGGGNSGSMGGAGGGGGSGGCGGAGGVGGETGGSSIGILAFQATVVLSDVTISTQSSGSGGTGGPAQPGQAGASPGGGGGSGNCLAGAGGGAGGAGGIGAGGGGGGGGAGGLSAGIVWHGSVAPTINGTAVSSQATGVTGITTGTPGLLGGGGNGGTGGGNAGPSGQPGAAGQAGDVIEL